MINIKNTEVDIRLNYNLNKGKIKIQENKNLSNFASLNEIDFDHNSNIVLLTKRNANIIEGLIKKDINYIPFSFYIYSYFTFNKIKYNGYVSLLALIMEIDRDNSTQVSRFGNNQSILNVVDYIVKDINFFDKLKYDLTLPDELNKCGLSLKSLSSKICKFLSEYIHGDNVNTYYINDSVIRKTLLFYLDYYKVPKILQNNQTLYSTTQIDKLSYCDLHYLLDLLNNATGQNQTKSESDHIIWYSYKRY